MLEMLESSLYFPYFALKMLQKYTQMLKEKN